MVTLRSLCTVFVSHASVDRQFVERQLIPFLHAHGLRTWYCKDLITTGSHWERAIRDGLQSADWFLVVVSPQSVRSEWVRCEVDWALENRPTRIVPLIIGNASAGDLHLRLRLVQSIDWRSPSEEARERLLAVWELPRVSHEPGSSSPSADLKFDDYLYSRPKNWHCIFCGWECNESFNDYICKQCSQLRPFAGGSATMVKCSACEGFSLAVARYCEWCGERIGA